MYMAVTNVVMLEMFNHIHPKDKDYFRQSREAMFKPLKLEQVALHLPVCDGLAMTTNSMCPSSRLGCFLTHKQLTVGKVMYVSAQGLSFTLHAGHALSAKVLISVCMHVPPSSEHANCREAIRAAARLCLRSFNDNVQ